MAFKTLTIDETAYKLLKSAKLSEKESFSDVIKRTIYPPANNNSELLRSLVEFDGIGVFSSSERDFLNRARKTKKRSKRQ